MKLIIIKSHIKDALSAVERAGGEGLNLPILKNFLLETSAGKVRFAATNLEVAVSITVPAKIIQEGSLTVPMGVFSSLINNLQTERLNLEKKGNSLRVTTENYEATIQGLPASEFPLIPKIEDGKNYIEIKGELFKEAMGQALAAAQFSELRQELNNILLNFSLETLKFVATDSFRLAEKTIRGSEFSNHGMEEFRLLMPLKTAHELVRVLKSEDTVKISRDAHQILFQTAHLEFISRLAEGTFPEYGEVLPKKFGTEAVVGREEFIDALKLAGTFGSKSGEVRLRVSEGKKAIEVFSADQALGENTYLMPAEIHGAAAEAGFNWRYLVDGLKALRGSEAHIGFNKEENKPTLLKAKGDESYFYIVMPLLKT